MLPKQHRLRLAKDFRATLRSRHRVRVRYFQMYLRGEPGPARVGLVVGGKVGNSVQRHRISRQIRETVRPRLGEFVDHDIVIRALPGAATLTGPAIRAELTQLLSKGAVDA